MHINGRTAMGEDIGDPGGLTVSLQAIRRSLGGKPAPVIDGSSGEQRLLPGWAQAWRTLWRDDALRQQRVKHPLARPDPRLRPAAHHRCVARHRRRDAGRRARHRPAGPRAVR
jgi:predicted metalloendopeptidase